MNAQPQDFERMFAEAFAFESDAEIEAIIRCAKRLWKAGDNVTAYYILNAFWLGIRAHAQNPENAEAINKKFIPITNALYQSIMKP